MACAVCGNFATKENLKGIPLCGRHTKEGVTAPYCKDCGNVMTIRKSKFGAFWGCSFYPACIGTINI